MAFLVFQCPDCHAQVPAHDITLAPLSSLWVCGKCGEVNYPKKWGNAMDGTPATSVFLYQGPRKHENVFQKLPRAVMRKDVFAGGDYAKIQQKATLNVDLRIGSFEPVAIYHCRERYTLRGRYYTPAQVRRNKVVLLLSGSGGVASVYFRKVVPRYLKRLGVPVLMMDYRGFGQSDHDKTPSSKGLYTDAEAMFRFLVAPPLKGGKGFATNTVVVHGFSLGTGVAMELAKRHNDYIGGLILQCPWTSAAAMARQEGTNLVGPTAGKIAHALTAHGTKMDIRHKLRTVTRPVLVLIAHEDDAMRAHGQALWDTRTWKPGNISIKSYDGTHLQPENAFKDGTGHTLVQTGWDPTKGGVQVDYRAPKPGENVLQDKNAWGNLKDASYKKFMGQGCINQITQWYDSF